MNPLEFAARLIVFCGRFQGSVTSWGRTQKRNGELGGHPFSKHMLFLGADVVYDEPVPEIEREKAAQQLGLILVIEEDHDHLQSKG